MSPAIRVSGLSKLYRVGARQQGYQTLRESIADAFWSPVNRIRQSFAPRAAGTDGAAGRRGAGILPANSEVRSQKSEIRSRKSEVNPDCEIRPPTSDLRPPTAPRLSGQNFWALNDVSFDIQPGEVVGIIGRNGAGKSTLLKILSRITEPTSGRIELRGRVGSLLEVGTGFHPELTGRENIYMNGSVLGMSRREISRKFDEIVDFSGVEDFLDTPVKRYSSGMTVRLAFAVAAHLEPEILIVDEVLAVGDATFQRRCIDHMSAIAKHGRTILFVSHNMDVIPRLCTHSMLLERGQIAAFGESPDIVRRYLATDVSDDDDLASRQRTGNGLARFEHLTLHSEYGEVTACHTTGNTLTLNMDITSSKELSDIALAVTLRTASGAAVISSWTREHNYPVRLQPGRNSFQCQFDSLNWRPGHPLVLSLWMDQFGISLDYIPDARAIDVESTPRTMHYSTDRQQGALLCNSKWRQL